MQRWVIHVDMDAFFAAIEQRDHPEYAGHPVIVGGLSSRGVVSTASYEARRFGVHSAMPMEQARQRCPEGIFLAGRYPVYRKVSEQLREILQRYSPLVEPLALDEAFLDATGMEGLCGHPLNMAKAIQAEIAAKLQLTASAGVGANKFLAKLASDWKKPAGLFLIEPGKEREFLAPLPVRRIWGIGRVAEQILHRRGIQKVGQLAAMQVKELSGLLGQQAGEWIRLAQGLDDRPVLPNRPLQSIGKEQTYEQDLTDWEQAETCLLDLACQVGWRLRRRGLGARTVSVKIRYPSFQTITRSLTTEQPLELDQEIYEIARTLARPQFRQEGIRLLGVTVSQLMAEGGMQDLFDTQRQKQVCLAQTLDLLKDRFGPNIIMRGRLLPKR